jgi:hypothetical protein
VSDVPRALVDAVVARARGRCEYCRLSQAGQEAAFHIDHVHPRAAGGITTLENLALACVSCSLRKWAKMTAVDPLTGGEVQLFNPRSDDWAEHFRWDGAFLIPISSVGRGTADALAMNRPMVVAIRAEEMIRGRHPPE